MKVISSNGFSFKYLLILQYILIGVMCIFLYAKTQQTIEEPLRASGSDADHFIKQALAREPSDRVSFSDVATQLEDDNLFRFSSDVVEQHIESIPAVVENKEIKVDFELVGVIEDVKGVEAIFENKKNRQIFYLKQNEVFDGFKLIEVYEEKVVLEKANQRIELNKNGK